ncbi:hypothetical protein LXL04_003712 [Taraxacum kok-saghyz]
MSADGGGWRIVTRRKNLRNGGDNMKETSIFIANIPEDCTTVILWKIFKSFGRMVDAYIPYRKNKGGKKFGFLKFIHVNDSRTLVDNINATKIDGMRIEANVSLYPKRRQPNMQNAQSRGTTYERAAGGRNTNGRRENNLNNFGDRQQAATNSALPGRSFKDALNGGNYSMDKGHRKTTVISPTSSEFSESCKKKALIGEAQSMEKLDNLIKNLKAEGLQDISVKYMGGLRALLVFKDESSASTFLTEGKTSWSNWFTSLAIFNGQPLNYQRIAWIKIEGVPFHVWDSHCFESIGGLFGRVLTKVKSPQLTKDIAAGGLSILVQSVARIEEEVDILWRDKRYTVHVAEDTWPWVPTFVDEVEEKEEDSEEEDNFNDANDVMGFSDVEELPEDGEFREMDGDNGGVEEAKGETEDQVSGIPDTPMPEYIPAKVQDVEVSRVAESTTNHSEINADATSKENPGLRRIENRAHESEHARETPENGCNEETIRLEVPVQINNWPNPMSPDSISQPDSGGPFKNGPINNVGNSGGFMDPGPIAEPTTDPITNQIADPNSDPSTVQIPDLNRPLSSTHPRSDSSTRTITNRRKGSHKIPPNRPAHSLKLKDTLWVNRSSQMSTSTKSPSTATIPMQCVSQTTTPQDEPQIRLETNAIPRSGPGSRSNSTWINNAIEDEARETMYVGNCLGFQMEGFNEQMKALVSELGVHIVSP